MTPKDLPVEVCACRLCTEERESETVSALGVRGYPLEVTRGTLSPRQQLMARRPGYNVILAGLI